MTAQWFGEYEIVQKLRIGGMATLYLARRHGAAGFSRLVALKTIHPRLAAQPDFVEMFVDEARICSQISHPNVVHVEEFGVIDGVHYLVMEYLDGCSISDLLKGFHHDRRTLDPELAARIVAQIAGGLHAAHESRDQHGKVLDIIHRDISPSNILLSVDGNAKLIDFGIAKARNRRAVTHADGALKGKYRYVAPEQAKRAVVDRRCDVFSLGVVFWEMLVGQPLFTDDTPAALVKRLSRTEVQPPSARNPAVPVAFDPIVLAMLEHEPEGRPQTAAEVQRRIVAAAPGAANREASELGAIAVEIRDRRARWLAQRNARGATEHDTQQQSLTPRTVKPRGMRGIIVVPDAVPERSIQHEATAPVLAMRTRAFDRRVTRLAVAIVLVVGMIGGVLLGQRSSRDAGATVRRDGERAAAKPGAPVEAARPVEASPPNGASPPIEAARPIEAPARAAPAPGASSVELATPVPRSPRPDGARAQRPPARRTDDGARPAPPPATPPSIKGPAILRDFDDASHGVEPTPATKRPPIVPRFDQ
jgi:serine/threonine protein kinase